VDKKKKKRKIKKKKYKQKTKSQPTTPHSVESVDIPVNPRNPSLISTWPTPPKDTHA